MSLIERYSQLFPDYQFIKLVGQGSYVYVFYCYRKADKKKVALKIVLVGDCVLAVDSRCETE